MSFVGAVVVSQTEIAMLAVAVASQMETESSLMAAAAAPQKETGSWVVEVEFQMETASSAAVVVAAVVVVALVGRRSRVVSPTS